jgi:hypothetical protein
MHPAAAVEIARPFIVALSALLAFLSIACLIAAVRGAR